MNVEAGPFSELQRLLAGANQRGQKVEQVALSALSRLVAHNPEDMTATVQGGMSLAQFQSAVAQGNQWLPIDPPNPERLTISELIHWNWSGPRRFGFGTVRDYLIGMRMVLPDGRLIRAGGNVVKNVAGYDLCKLAIGSQGTLGIVVEATFKLLPLPERECSLQMEFDSLDAADAVLLAISESALTPVVIDLFRAASDSKWQIILGFAGAQEDVESQKARAAELGFRSEGDLAAEQKFWSGGPVRQCSVPPGNLASTLRQIEANEVVVRAGNGMIYYRGGKEPSATPVPEVLFARVKNAFDPKHILPELKINF